MNLAPIHFLEQRIDDLLALYVNDVSARLAAGLGSVALAGLTLYYLMLGLSFARGEVAEPLGRLLKDALGQLLVCIVVLGGTYQGAVVGFIGSLQTDLIGGVTTGRAQTVGETLDLLFTGLPVKVRNEETGKDDDLPMNTALLELALRKANHLGIPDLSYAVAGLVVALTFAIVCGLCLLPIILAKIGLSIMLAIGPVFVLLLLWPATRSYFNSWLSATLGFVLTSVLVATVCTLVPTAFSQTLQVARGGAGPHDFNPMSVAIATLIVGVGLGFTALHVSQKGAQLAGGGIAMDSKGIAGTIVQSLLIRMLTQPPGQAASARNSITQGQGGNAAGQPAGAPGSPGTASSRLNSIVSGLENRNRQEHRP